MFCPSCGAESTIELNYCNRCGANLNVALLAPAEIAPVNVTKPIIVIGLVMLFLTLGAFAGILSSAIEVARTAGGGDLSMAIVFFGMVTVLIIDILLFMLLSKLIKAALSSPAKLPARKPAPASQDRSMPPTTARLPLPPSVTENTTRFFDPYSPAQTPDPVVLKNKTER
jgi:hypothetical protein